MTSEERKLPISNIMFEILDFLNSPQEKNNRAAYLAKIRNSIGKNFEEATDVWSIIFPFIPPKFLGNGPLSCEEKSIFITLQLYANGQQGLNKVLVSNDKNKNFGSSLQQIKEQDSVALDRRFNTMLTATTFDEFAYHLRQIFRLAKSKESFSVNFIKLSEDLFWYQNGKERNICLSWAKDYYHYAGKNEDL